MKLGMILECAPNGPDYQVCKQLLPMINPDIDPLEPNLARTLTNKALMIKGCGLHAKQLLEIGCERVIILWDLYPPWRDKKPSRDEDRKRILESLTTAGVALDRVALVCITAELEAWLLADERAIAEVLRKLARPDLFRGVARCRRPESERTPKQELERIFRENGCQPYRDYSDAKKIAEKVEDLSRLRRCCSFSRFEDKVLGRSRSVAS